LQAQRKRKNRVAEVSLLTSAATGLKFVNQPPESPGGEFAPSFRIIAPFAPAMIQQVGMGR